MDAPVVEVAPETPALPEALVEAVSPEPATDSNPAPASVEAPPETPAGVFIVNGEAVSPETHRFKNGLPVIGKNGKALRRPGPSKGKAPTQSVPTDTAVASATDAPAAPAPAPSASAPAPAPAPTPVVVRPATAVVTRVYGKIGAPETKNEELEVRSFVTEPAVVEIGYGLTLNIGNYESARVDVKISLPCYAEEANAAYEYAKKWTEERVQIEVKDVRKLASGKSNSPF